MLENLIEKATWILVVMSLLGNIFVIRKNVIGQWLWAVANVGWVTYDVWIGANSQAFLFLIYFFSVCLGHLCVDEGCKIGKSSTKLNLGPGDFPWPDLLISSI